MCLCMCACVFVCVPICHTQQLPQDVLSRSVLAATLDSTPTLLVGMGDGSVISYAIHCVTCDACCVT